MRYRFYFSANHIIPAYLKRFKIYISEYFALSLRNDLTFYYISSLKHFEYGKGIFIS